MYFDASKVLVKVVSKNLVENFIINKHYAKTWTSANLIFGVYHIEDNTHKFFNEQNEKLIGCVLYGHPVGFRVVKSISENLTNGQVWELKRLWIEDGYGTNIESFVIAKTINYIKINHAEIKVLISYADPSVNHIGIIYRASNWLFQGNEIGSGDAWMFKYPNTDKWISDRAIGSQLGTNSLSGVLKIIPDMQYKRKPRKNRYIYLTCNKKEKRNIMKSLKHPIIKY
jgi:hypothetical protein